MKYFNLLDNKVFISLANTANGDVNSATGFYYSQKRLGDYCQGWGGEWYKLARCWKDTFRF
ncbi:hypothetical protein [Acinetobacter bereziniae]|uniref:hypothetical protein n=1 Tax=Acinetobacter bereziniae TaxID=106648 RepID=UPI0011172571|nr:hypothetical protein [Acinetobacter bereziniae]TNL42965.1 hypothetical protein EYB59_22240 [Acinetobacter bereziniae]TNL49907.1 hypothetical protein EYY58_21740 [Acinetobacter bereziniae]